MKKSTTSFFFRHIILTIHAVSGHAPPVCHRRVRSIAIRDISTSPSQRTVTTASLSTRDQTSDAVNRAILTKQVSAIKFILDSLSTYPDSEVKRKAHLQTLYPVNDWVKTYATLASSQHLDTLLNMMSEAQKQLIQLGETLDDNNAVESSGTYQQRLRWASIKKIFNATQDNSSGRYSHLRKELEGIYLPILSRYLQPSIPLSEKPFQLLFQYSVMLYKCLSQNSFTPFSSFIQPSSKRRDLLLPIFASVSQALEGNQNISYTIAFLTVFLAPFFSFFQYRWETRNESNNPKQRIPRNADCMRLFTISKREKYIQSSYSHL
jgi:hypothetical protein